MAAVHHRTAMVDGHAIFYREAGRLNDPHVVLLHGYPTSSHMFRQLIPVLSDRYHLIAPDYVGFGFSDAPPVAELDYSFDALAAVTSALLSRIGVDRFAMYVQDYGAPVGWRIALNHPDRVSAIISQNGNAYEEGFVESYWDPIWAYASAPGPGTEGPVRDGLTLDAIRWQYTHGVPDTSLVSPDCWHNDFALLQRPGMDEVQLALVRDYPSNVDLYPDVHEYFRSTQVPALVVWGANDEIFGPAGAKAFNQDLPRARVHLLDAGHFALESNLDIVSDHIRGFLAQVPC
jgi:pimeloyl-ACP methyl ester carboxylesterase